MSPKPTDQPSEKAMDTVYTLVAKLSDKYSDKLQALNQNKPA